MLSGIITISGTQLLPSKTSAQSRETLPLSFRRKPESGLQPFRHGRAKSGLDPAIPSRASDARVKPAHDESLSHDHTFPSSFRRKPESSFLWQVL
jgi:hypothetical protein